MFLKNKALAINSTLIVIATTILGTILHEVSHYLLALYYDLNPELHHNYVWYQTSKATVLQQTTTAMIGPVFSLTTGILFITLSIKMKRINLGKLFLLWMGMNGILMFMGYLLIAPFAKEGDTGKVFSNLGLPQIAVVAIAIFSFILIVKIFSRLSQQFRFYKTFSSFNQKENTKQLFIIPLLVSTPIIAILNLPIITWVSLLPVIFMPMTYISTLKSYAKLKLSEPEYSIRNISIPLLITTIFSVALFIYIK